ncbi:MAG: hypothetical protein B7733_13090 [Myxococcales bacterium FL481]|nr:MAG: hypothetical protein B7733_13090 [Myxococcales bacterium FL481]
MSWEDQLSKAIRARVIADTGSGGLFETGGNNKLLGVFFEQLPENQTFPAVMYEFSRQTTADTAAKRSIEIDVRTHVFVSMSVGDQRLRDIVERLRGNWQAMGGTPSRGLDRWQPTGLANYDVTELGHQDSISEHEWDAGVYHVIDEYLCMVTEKDS